MVGSQGGPELGMALVRGTHLEYSPLQQNWSRRNGSTAVLRTTNRRRQLGECGASIGEAVTQSGLNLRRRPNLQVSKQP